MSVDPLGVHVLSGIQNIEQSRHDHFLDLNKKTCTVNSEITQVGQDDDSDDSDSLSVTIRLNGRLDYALSAINSVSIVLLIPSHQNYC
ncbi:unnamed protein product [Protopolystoma xenopodis]|uniref:Uncharacterized protein n=1 Tax=Protopolystoma xenopodis TaxID=117903 RepID=A0A3S5CHZ0_9PLAT|nr:unnamed protein product [Protopolystoma xenopodis]